MKILVELMDIRISLGLSKMREEEVPDGIRLIPPTLSVLNAVVIHYGKPTRAWKESYTLQIAEDRHETPRQ